MAIRKEDHGCKPRSVEQEGLGLSLPPFPGGLKKGSSQGGSLTRWKTKPPGSPRLNGLLMLPPRK